MDRFVARQNLQHFKELLAKEQYPDKRRTLERLIHDEAAKLEEALRDHEGDPDLIGRKAAAPHPDDKDDVTR